MVARFDADVIEEAPDLVLWQVGSNSVLRDHPTPGEVIRQGVERLKASGTEVILINPQYAPKILAKPDVDRAVDVITATARDAEVGLFNRFMVMRNWVEGEKMSFDQFLSPDGLHMNDWSYACIAKLLASAILEDTKLPPAIAAAGDGHPALNRRYTLSSAASRSSHRSSGCSSPHDRRTIPSVMPSSARAAGPMRWCVVVAGWVIRLLASPRLFEMRTSLSASWKRNAPALPPLISNATSVEPPFICFCATAACGWSGRPG